MGSEYAVFNGKIIKTGRDGMMYDLRWNQKELVGAAPGKPAPMEQLEHLWFRAPRVSESSVSPGEYSFTGWCGVKPIRFVCRKDKDGDVSRFERELMDVLRAAPGAVRVHNDNVGVDVAIPCCHGYTSDELPNNMQYNGLVTSTLGVAAVGVRNGKAVALLGCLACGAVLPCYYTLEDLESNCDPANGEEDDWRAMLDQLRDIQNFVQSRRGASPESRPVNHIDDEED